MKDQNFKSISGWTGALLLGAMAASAPAEFVPGHIFVSDEASKHCQGPFETYPGDRIWEIDPETGEVSLFVELRDEWCGGIGALVFTPDGSRLRAAQRFANRIIELDADANPSVLYDGSDGIAVPFGYNSIAYDREGNFYVAGFDRIVRFPAGSDVSEIYADRVTDPLVGNQGGGITIDAVGDLYFATDTAGRGRIVRFQGPHNGSLFEMFAQGVEVTSITSDSCGNLFVGLNPFTTLDPRPVYRYSSGDPGTKVLLAQIQDINYFGIALDPTESFLYIEARKIWRVSIEDGSAIPIAEITVGPGIGEGMAVVPVQNPPYGFTPCPPPIPALSTWGVILLAILFLVAGKLKRNCVRSE